MKVCNKCRTAKDAAEFHARAISPDGLGYTCKDCARARAREHYREVREKYGVLVAAQLNADRAAGIVKRPDAAYYSARHRARKDEFVAAARKRYLARIAAETPEQCVERRAREAARHRAARAAKKMAAA